MADDVTLPASAGTFNAASDEIGGRHFQRIKVTWGADGTAGDVTAANRFPVDIGTPTIAVTGTFFQATQPVSGTVTANAGTGTFAISAASLPLPTGAATSAKQDSIITALGSPLQAGGSVSVTGSVAVTGTFWQATQPVSGPLTDTQLRATAVPVSGTVTANAGTGTFAISATALPLPTGAATETTLASINTKTPALGQAAMASSQPVTIASDQSAVSVAIPDVSANGSITTQNLVPAGVATAGSAVELVLSGRSGGAVQVVGTYTGALSLQGTLDGTNWITIGGTPLLNVNTGAMAATIASATQGIFQFEAGAFLRVRLTALAAVTGTATVTLRATEAPSVFALDAALPTGANVIGAVTQSGTWNVGTVTTLSGGTVSPLTVAGVTIETSAARTATANGTTITNASAEGAHFFINVSAVSGTTPTLVGQLQYQDPVSTNFVDVPGAATISISTVSTVMLSVIPGISEAANSKVNSKLPRVFRWRWTIGGTTPSFTFSIGAAYVV